MKNILLLFFFVSMMSCQKADLNITVKSEVFQCCNIWGDTTTAADTPETLPAFLDEKNIEFTDIVIIDNELIVLCTMCCNCPAGKTVEFKVSSEDLEEVLDLGFVEK